MRPIAILTTVVALLGAMASAEAQNQGSKAALKQQLESQYALTQPTADNTDIVTAGAVLVLQRGKVSDQRLVMAAVSGKDIYQNTYRDGKLTQNDAATTKNVAKGVGRFGRFI